MGVRRVVSGVDARGRAVVVSDEIVEGGRHGNMGGVTIWGGDEVPKLPNDGRRPPEGPLFPGPSGFRFSILTIYPDSEARKSDQPNQRELREYVDVLEDEASGMHATDTVDFEVVLSGEASIELDDGAVVHLKPGDTFIQNGTRHRWFNRGTEPAVLGVAIIGGHRK